jgi:hypothetical protein
VGEVNHGGTKTRRKAGMAMAWERVDPMARPGVMRCARKGCRQMATHFAWTAPMRRILRNDRVQTDFRISKALCLEHAAEIQAMLRRGDEKEGHGPARTDPD